MDDEFTVSPTPPSFDAPHKGFTRAPTRVVPGFIFQQNPVPRNRYLHIYFQELKGKLNGMLALPLTNASLTDCVVRNESRATEENQPDSV